MRSQEHPDSGYTVSRYLNFFSFLTLLHTCCTAPIVINQPVCAGGRRIHSDFLLRKVQFFTLVTAFFQYSKCLLVLLRQQRKTFHCSRLRATPLKLSKRSPTSLTNMVVARDLLFKAPERNIKKHNETLFKNWLFYEIQATFTTALYDTAVNKLKNDYTLQFRIPYRQSYACQSMLLQCCTLLVQQS